VSNTELQIEFERCRGNEPNDETDFALRSYVAGLSDERLAGYDASWADDQVAEWDGNFRSDGALMLVCCERDVDVGEFRQMVEEFLRFRDQARKS
jgi:hypothetical protein